MSFSHFLYTTLIFATFGRDFFHIAKIYDNTVIVLNVSPAYVQNRRLWVYFDCSRICLHCRRGRYVMGIVVVRNPPRPKQNGHRFVEDNFKCNFVIKIVVDLYLFKSHCNLFSRIQLPISHLVEILAWCRTVDKPQCASRSHRITLVISARHTTYW